MRRFSPARGRLPPASAPGQVFPCVNDREAFHAPSRSDFLKLSRSRCPPPARAGDGLLGRAFPLSRPPARATRQLIVTPHRRSHQSSGTARPRADGKTSKGPDSKNSHRERPSFLPRNLSRPETRKTHTCVFAPARLLESWRHPPEHFDTVRGSRGPDPTASPCPVKNTTSSHRAPTQR